MTTGLGVPGASWETWAPSPGTSQRGRAERAQLGGLSHSAARHFTPRSPRVMALCCIHPLSIVSTITVMAGSGGSVFSMYPGDLHQPCSRQGQVSGDSSSLAGAWGGTRQRGHRKDKESRGRVRTMHRSRSSPSLPALANHSGSRARQDAPHTALPTSMSAEVPAPCPHPTSSMGRGTPFPHTLPHTDPLELAPNPRSCPASFCDVLPPPSPPGRVMHRHHRSPKQRVSTG